MFESLDAESTRELKRWQAPRLDARIASIVDPRPVARDTTYGDHAVNRNADVGVGVARDGVGGAAGSGLAPMPLEAAAAVATTVSVEQAARASEALGQQLQQRFDAGREVGFEEGVQSARRQAEAESLAGAAILLEALARAGDRHEHELEDEVIALSRAMARLILRRELAHDPEQLRAIVSEALERLPLFADAPTVHLHPADVDALTPLQPNEEPVSLVADESMERGDCRIEAGASIVDAGIDAWVDSLDSSEIWRRGAPVAS